MSRPTMMPHVPMGAATKDTFSSLASVPSAFYSGNQATESYKGGWISTPFMRNELVTVGIYEY